MLTPHSAHIFTVSRLNTTVRKLLEMEIGQIWLNAEISNFSQPASGHWYFSLKDSNAQVRCAMFRHANRRMTFRPQNGQQVLVRATITLYEPRGDYQLIAESLQPAGDGLLQQKFEQLKQRLAQEGLFDQQYKKSLPQPVRQLGIITSATGAALYDILRILQRRDPSLPVIIYPTPVQGSEAAERIANAIMLANQRAECDVLIVGRGGGSLEDLWSFNDETVARAIFNSKIPVISAVGHEIDVTIADLVADLRAATPSAAAELVSRDQQEKVRQLTSLRQRVEMAMDYFLTQQTQTFSRLHHRLQQQHPQLQLSHQQTRLLRQQRRLSEALGQQLRRALLLHERLNQRLDARQPQPRIYHLQQQLQQRYWHLQQLMQNQLNDNKQRFSTLAAQLEGVSPLATLSRGFSITTVDDGNVVKRTRQLKPGDQLKTRLQDGWVESRVTSLHVVKKAHR